MIVMYVITGEVGQVGMIILMSYTKELEDVLLCGGMLGSQGRDLYVILAGLPGFARDSCIFSRQI